MNLTRRELLQGVAVALTGVGVSSAPTLAARKKQAAPAKQGPLRPSGMYYVRPDGNDLNSGLTDSPRGAFRTWQGAYDKITLLDFNNRVVTLKAGGNGLRAFAAPRGQGILEISNSWRGGGTLVVHGDSDSPGNVVLSATDAPCFRLRSNLTGKVRIEGFELRAPDNWGMRHGARGNLAIGNLIFDTCENHVGVEASASYMETFAPYLITGDADRHIDCDAGFMYFHHRITVVGERKFNAFIRARNGGRFISDMSFEVQGNVHGHRFEVKELSLINTQGRGLEHFPGNIVGIESTGGVYVR